MATETQINRKVMCSFSIEPMELEKLRKAAREADRSLSAYIRTKLRPKRRSSPRTTA